MFGKDIDTGSQVKYLGVILDCKLNWIAHVQDRAQKALAAFWICKNAFGRSWGLSSKAILWIYTAIIRPMMLHGCIVWWPRLDIERAKKELGEIQRLVCICITGTMKTTATAAMEILLNLPPVQTVAQSKAFAAADRLAQGGMWLNNFNSGHGKINTKIADPIFKMPRDRLIPETDFTRHFKAIMPERTDWLNGWPTTLPVEGCIGFTDGSKTSEGTGAGVHIPEPETNDSYHLGSLNSVFQAEVYAILMSSIKMLPQCENGKTVSICSDSESAIKALMSPVVTSKLVKRCKENLNQAGLGNHITLVWVPGHSGIEGNERADELARLGSASNIQSFEASIPIPQAECNTALKKWVMTEHARTWESYSGGKHTKRFFQRPDEKWSKKLLIMDRSQIRKVVGAITGHCGLNKHLATMGLSNDPMCACGLGEETGIHLICECPKFLTLRQRTLGDRIMEPWEVPRLGPSALHRFLAGTKRFR